VLLYPRLDACSFTRKEIIHRSSVSRNCWCFFLWWNLTHLQVPLRDSEATYKVVRFFANCYPNTRITGAQHMAILQYYGLQPGNIHYIFVITIDSRKWDPSVCTVGPSRISPQLLSAPWHMLVTFISTRLLQASHKPNLAQVDRNKA
jgi:hypothetical protein